MFKVGDYIGRRANYSPNLVAVMDASKKNIKSFSYSEMNNRSCSLAYWLLNKAKLIRGDKILVICGNCIEQLDIFFACVKIGIIYVPINFKLKFSEIKKIIDIINPKVVIYSNDVENNTIYLIKKETKVEYYLGIGENLINNNYLYEEIIINNLKYNLDIDNHDFNENEIVAIFFTGGTTGYPKGVMISHKQIAWNFINTFIHDLEHKDIYLNILPMFHVGGMLVYTISQIIIGNKIIIVNKFDADFILKIIDKEKVTIIAAVPSMYYMLVNSKNWDSCRLNSIRSCISGGSPLNINIIEKFYNEKGVSFKQGFGMTEFGPSIFVLDNKDVKRKIGSIGKPNFYVESRIIDDLGKDTDPNIIGELIIKGPSISGGYFKNSELFTDENGWFHTGDLAYRDSEDYYYITGRKKDMFISGGENVYPLEIETEICKHVDVQDCLVVGVSHEVWGEVGKAFVVLKKGSNLNSNVLISFLRSRIANYKIPLYFDFVNEIPLSITGKPLRKFFSSKVNK